MNLATPHRADTQGISLGEASCMYPPGSMHHLDVWAQKKGKLTTSRRYNHPTVASVKTWRSSGGACRVGLTHRKSTTFFPHHQLYPPQNFHTPPFSPPFATTSRHPTSPRHRRRPTSSIPSSSSCNALADIAIHTAGKGASVVTPIISSPVRRALRCVLRNAAARCAGSPSAPPCGVRSDADLHHPATIPAYGDATTPLDQIPCIARSFDRK